MGLLDARLLVELLGAAQQNHSVIANNLANLNTPGYRTVRLRFTEELDRLLDSRGRLRPGRSIATRQYRPLFPGVNADGNDVTLEREVVELNKNALRMRIYLAVLGSEVHRLRAAIDGR